jgi:hypothetical protein
LETLQGVRQGCILSAYLFIVYAEYIMRIALETYDGGLSIGGYNLKDLRYADDTTLFAKNLDDLKRVIRHVKCVSEEYGLFLNVKKTKIMIIHPDTDFKTVEIDGSVIEVVDHFNYLGSIITNKGDSTKEIRRRLGQARSTMKSLDTIWKDKSVSKPTKIRMIHALVFPIAIYACETWALTVCDRKRIQSFEMWCWRRMLDISWKAHRTNVSVLDEIKPDSSLISSVDRQKLRYFGHISCRSANSMEQTIMFGIVEGRRSCGRPRMRWSDNIKSLTGLSLHSCKQLAQNRNSWRSLIYRVTNVQVEQTD